MWTTWCRRPKASCLEISAEHEEGLYANQSGLLPKRTTLFRKPPPYRWFERSWERIYEVGQDDFRLAELNLIIAARPASGWARLVSSGEEHCRELPQSCSLVLPFENEQRTVGEPSYLQREIPSEKIKKRTACRLRMAAVGLWLRDLLDAPLYVDDTPSLFRIRTSYQARRLVPRTWGKGDYHRPAFSWWMPAACRSAAVRKRWVRFRVRWRGWLRAERSHYRPVSVEPWCRDREGKRASVRSWATFARSGPLSRMPI